MNRRRFLEYLCWLGMAPKTSSGLTSTPHDLYDLTTFGNITLMHFTDSHAQLLPIYYREPSNHSGVGTKKPLFRHLEGQKFLKFFGLKPGSREAYAFSHLDFTDAAVVYGKMGGFAHLATLIKQIRAARGKENTLLLDGGDSWQGSATSLWTQGQDMIAAANLLGVDMMTGHWEFSYGSDRVMKNINQFKGDFLAHNISLSDEAQFSDEHDDPSVFKAYRIREIKGAKIAVIGQAFPYTPIAHPKRFTPAWQFGIQEQNLRTLVEQIKSKHQANVTILLSHNGLDVDLKLASRVSGIDLILGGHTHDALPRPIMVANPGGKTWVTNAGSHGKFLAVIDLQITNNRLKNFRYRLLPVFANLLEPDLEMQQLINTTRAPYVAKLQQPLVDTDQLLYRRDTYQGTFDRLILDALCTVNDTELALSPGFRWGTTLLPGHTIRYEDIMNHTAITYPETYIRPISGKELKDLLEDVADNLFNPDPYYRQGGDMVRVGGMHFKCNSEAVFGSRISQMTLKNGRPVAANKRYKTSGWASVQEIATSSPIQDVVVQFLKHKQ
jgi:S-sulfosulfanyl-L-cysteine sulfohydrolase